MPRQPHHKKLSDILNQKQAINRSKALRTLFAGASSRESIHTRFEECLPEQLKGHFVVAGLSQGILTLHCASASLATRFRFEQDKVLKSLQMRLGQSQITAIKVQIRPNAVPKPPAQKKQKRLNANKRGQTAEERLSEVLERLSSRSE